MSIPMDHFAQTLCIAMNQSVNNLVAHQQVADAMEALSGDVRDLEMMISHYKHSVDPNVNSPIPAIKYRSLGARTAMQDAAMDFERRLESIRKHVQELSMHLDL